MVFSFHNEKKQTHESLISCHSVSNERKQCSSMHAACMQYEEPSSNILNLNQSVYQHVCTPSLILSEVAIWLFRESSLFLG